MAPEGISLKDVEQSIAQREYFMNTHNKQSTLSSDAQLVFDTISLPNRDYDGLGMLDAFVRLHYEGESLHFDVKTHLDQASRVENAFLELETNGFVHDVTGHHLAGVSYELSVRVE